MLVIFGKIIIWLKKEGNNNYKYYLFQYIYEKLGKGEDYLMKIKNFDVEM